MWAGALALAALGSAASAGIAKLFGSAYGYW